MAINNLQKVLNVDNPNWSDHIVAPRKGDHISVNQYVDIFVAFDEAHTLSDSIDLKGQSRFVVLQHLLSFGTTLFVLSFHHWKDAILSSAWSGSF